MPVNNSLLIDNEALRARLKIRDFFLDNTVREIYQNVGQALSAVRLELDAARLDLAMIQAAGQIVAQAIRDLRRMGKNFNPDATLLEQEGFTESIKSVIGIVYPENAPAVTCNHRQADIRPEVKFIAFNAFLKMLVTIKENQKECSSVLVSSTRRALHIALDFESTREEANSLGQTAGLDESVSLLNGQFHSTTRRSGISTWKLSIPLK